MRIADTIYNERPKPNEYGVIWFALYYTLLYCRDFSQILHSLVLKIQTVAELTINLLPADIKKGGSGYNLSLQTLQQASPN